MQHKTWSFTVTCWAGVDVQARKWNGDVTTEETTSRPSKNTAVITWGMLFLSPPQSLFWSCNLPHFISHQTPLKTSDWLTSCHLCDDQMSHLDIYEDHGWERDSKKKQKTASCSCLCSRFFLFFCGWSGQLWHQTVPKVQIVRKTLKWRLQNSWKAGFCGWSTTRLSTTCGVRFCKNISPYFPLLHREYKEWTIHRK